MEKTSVYEQPPYLYLELPSFFKRYSYASLFLSPGRGEGHKIVRAMHAASSLLGGAEQLPQYATQLF